MRCTLATALLLSSLFSTAAANASPPDNASAPTLRVSTGVTPPRLLNSLQITYSNMAGAPGDLPAGQFRVTFVVDESGHPRKIQIVKGTDPAWNTRIAEAVSRLRYRPASMNHQPVSMDVTLNIDLAR